jgi:hypothetical protein
LVNNRRRQGQEHLHVEGDSLSKKATVVCVSIRDASLKRRLRRHLTSLGFERTKEGDLAPPGTGKDAIRTAHSAQRRDRLTTNNQFLSKQFPKLAKHFASGSDIDPQKISPTLELIKTGTWQGDLFRLASLTWSVPVSNGFGRRLRYLVWDKHNDKLMGIIAIGDPVFNLHVRDSLIGWSVKDRSKRLVNIMDAYVLGALPPYNMLLGGKLVACLLRTRDIYDDFSKAYGDTTGIISKQEKKAQLLAITTSSSMGRSSVYSRLKLDGVEYFKSIGYTGGWGHFHIPDNLFSELRDFLRDNDHSYADRNSFGQGPNWRLRTTRAALAALGFKEDMLRHGIQREVFLCLLASNAVKLLHSGEGRANLRSLLSAHKVANLALERWIIPRSERHPEYKDWKAENIATLLGDQRDKLIAKLARTRQQMPGDFVG